MVTKTVSNEKELGEALKSNADEIIIEGDVEKKVIKIRATGKAAWAIAIGALAIAIGVAVGTGGTGAPASALIGTGAVGVLGVTGAASATAIAAAAGGVGALNKLRSYKQINHSDGRLVLKRT